MIYKACSRRKFSTLLFIIIISGQTTISAQTTILSEPIYTNIWGSLYNPEDDQCDDTPTITADGSKINYTSASDHRWVAVSQELIDDQYRLKHLVKDSADNRFKGKIKFGDTIWVDSPDANLNGYWIVHDVMNKRYTNGIDFLQTTGDSRLYGNNKLWSGRFNDISIYVNKRKMSKLYASNINTIVNILSVKTISIHTENVNASELIKYKFIETDTTNDIRIQNLHNTIERKKIELIKLKNEIKVLKSMLRNYKKQKNRIDNL
jgi:3D (Asp-Asp-Asp) domain-containing protein